MPEPKSACMVASAPIERTIASEFEATGSPSARWFQALSFGKTGQPPTRGAAAAVAGSASARAATKEAKRILVVHRRPVRRA
jgi:hypothetical protein